MSGYLKERENSAGRVTGELGRVWEYRLLRDEKELLLVKNILRPGSRLVAP